jgi:hypothetical protein
MVPSALNRMGAGRPPRQRVIGAVLRIPLCLQPRISNRAELVVVVLAPLAQHDLVQGGEHR